MNELKIESDNSNEQSLRKSDVESVDNDDEVLVKNSPFALEWIFGFNPEVPLINLTSDPSSKSFASASGHVFQIFSCDGNQMQTFLGHESEIFVLETNATGRFIVSADRGGVINIWDLSISREFPHPIRTIYQPYNHEQQRKLSKVAFSFDGKSLVTASDGRGSLIKLWQWTFVASDGTESANDYFELSEKYDQVGNVRFSPDIESSMLVITTFNGVVFGHWDKKRQKLQKHFPARAISISFRFVDTIFVKSSRQAISITSCGSAIIWSDVLTSSEHEEDENFSTCSFKKEFIKNIKLSENPLCVIRSIDGHVMICDNVGRIRFYDNDLKIVFWCPSHDSIDSIITISFDLIWKVQDDDDVPLVKDEKTFSVRDFFVQTKDDVFSVDVSQMKFNKIFYRSDDFVTAFDLCPHRSLVCCANYSGRIFIYDYGKKKQVVEKQLKLQRRKSSSSDTETIEIPHVTAISFSPDGNHLFCGLENGTLISLDPNVLHELKSFAANHDSVSVIKFSPDSTFITIYDRTSTVIVLYQDQTAADLGEWRILGKVRYHTKPICDVLYISTSSTSSHVASHHKLTPRLISLAQDRQIVEYDLTESTKESRGLVITFVKRIFQSALPVSMTLIYNSQKREDQLLVADTEMKFKLFDKNTFEILATFLGPIYDSYVKQFDANTSIPLKTRSNFLVFSTNKNICLYATPIDGNPFRSLGVVGHCSGVKHMRTDSYRKVLFVIGNRCRSLFMWSINPRLLFDHLEEGGEGLRPYCDLLPGGKFGFFFQQMQNLYFYMLMLSNNNSIDDQKVKEGLDLSEVADYMRGPGFFPSDYLIECLHHELQVGGKRKVAFEELVKLFINYSPLSNGSWEVQMEVALRKLCCSSEGESQDKIVVKKSQLVTLLTETAEKVDEKDAEMYLKEFFHNSSEIPLKDFMDKMTKVKDGGKIGCFA